MLGVSVLVFALVRLSGDPAALLLPPEGTAADRAAFRHDLGLDRPLPVQFAIFLRDTIRGDFGESTRFREPAASLFWRRFPATLELAAIAGAAAAMLGVGAGVLAAVRPRTPVARLLSLAALAGQAVPSFLSALLLIALFAVQLRWLPTSGRDEWRSYILPAASLAMFSAAALMRMTRAVLLETLRSDYIRTARGKGLRGHTVVIRHAARNAALPVLTLLSVQLAFFIGGSAVVESIFAWPGTGQLALQAVTSRDYPLVQAVVFFTAGLIVLLNIAADLLAAAADPRVRLE